MKDENGKIISIKDDELPDNIIEKYIKKKHSHDINELYEEVNAIPDHGGKFIRYKEKDGIDPPMIEISSGKNIKIPIIEAAVKFDEEQPSFRTPREVRKKEQEKYINTKFNRIKTSCQLYMDAIKILGEGETDGSVGGKLHKLRKKYGKTSQKGGGKQQNKKTCRKNKQKNINKRLNKKTYKKNKQNAGKNTKKSRKNNKTTNKKKTQKNKKKLLTKLFNLIDSM